MSHGIISGSQASFHYNCTQLNLPALKSMLEPCSHHLSFNTHLSKQSYSLKTQSGYFKTRPIATSTISNMYTSTETESLYDLLGISENGTVSEIKQAYKQLARKYHPDVSPPERIEEHTKRFIQVQEAYETLSDPKSRALYDRDLASGLHMAYSARNQFHYKEGFVERSEWKNQWWSQLKELKRRRMKKDSRSENISWGARMRRQRSEEAD